MRVGVECELLLIKFVDKHRYSSCYTDVLSLSRIFLQNVRNVKSVGIFGRRGMGILTDLCIFACRMFHLRLYFLDC